MSAAPAKDVAVGAAQDNQVVRLSVGDRLVVDLGPGWQPPRPMPLAGDPGPVTTPLRLESGPPGGGTAYVFVAVSAGSTAVRATVDAGAATSQRSPMLGPAWEVTVQVSSRPGFMSPGAAAG